MNSTRSKEDIQKLIVGTWHGTWASSAGGVSEDYYTFYQDGRWSHSDSMSNTVRNDGVTSGYSSSSESDGRYFISDAGELVLEYPSGQQWKPIFEVSRSGGDIRIGNIWFGRR